MTKIDKDKEESVFRGNEVMMMLEQMSDGIAVIAEEQKALRIELTGKIDDVRTELTGKIDDVRTELTGKIDDVRTELTGKIDDVRTEFKEEIQEFREEVNEKFDSVFEFLSNIEDELVDIRKEINVLKETKADDEKVIELDERVSALEKQFEMAKAKQVA